MIPIYKPYIPKVCKKYVNEAIDSSWISSIGKFIQLSQEKLQNILDVKHVLLVNNGTAATHLLAKAIQYKNPKIKYIICPNNVFVAAWNAFVYEDFELVPCDADLETWNVNWSIVDEKLASGFYTSENTAILVVHNLGNVINVPKLKERYKDFLIVEDNCEGFLGKYEGIYSGTQSLVSSISFFGNKTVTCGEGGAIVTNDTDLYEYLKKIHGQAMSSTKRYIHEYLGYNYRITNIQAAILLGQLENLDKTLNKKKKVFERYKNNLNKKIILPKAEENTEPSNWLFAIRYNDNSKIQLIKQQLSENGIETRPMFYPISAHGHLIKFNQDIEIANILCNQIIMLPSYPDLEFSDIDYISQIINSLL